MKVSDLKPGDVIATSKPKGFLPKAIRVFMWLWSVIHYRKIPKGKLYNHTITVYDTPLVAEAVAKGFTVHNFKDHYSDNDLSRMVVFRLKDPLTQAEVDSLRRKLLDMSYENIEYEIFNFFWWMIYIVSNGRWDISPKGSKQDDKVFCFEASAMLLNAGRKGLFENPSHVNTVDLQNDERFGQIYFM